MVFLDGRSNGVWVFSEGDLGIKGWATLDVSFAEVFN